MTDVEIITRKINPMAGQLTCGQNCLGIVDYFSDYLVGPDSSDLLAITHVYDYRNPSDYSQRGFGRTARNRARHAEKANYTTKIMSFAKRNEELVELNAINISAEIRQGTRMSEEYISYPEKWERIETCNVHRHTLYGAFAPDGTWVGYILARNCGEIVMIYRILGHSAYLKRESFMLNLWLCMVRDIMENHPHVTEIMYHLWNVGNPGLAAWKEQVGLRPCLYRPQIESVDSMREGQARLGRESIPGSEEINCSQTVGQHLKLDR
jgi:hypothetical protein